MNYCARCVLPDTRPGITIGVDGVCSACRAHEQVREDVDWEARLAELRRLAADARALARPYDCVVPVSGGKDSHWQVLTCRELGLHVLAVTWKTPGRSPLGARNLANLVELGVDHVDFQVNPHVERLFMLRSLERFGTPAIPMHLAIFHVPLTIAAQFRAPLVVYGENSAVEYVGDTSADTSRLDSSWVRQFGATHGTTASDWISAELSELDLTPYFGPSDEDLDALGIRAVFLGHYLRWDPHAVFVTARAHGFEPAPAPLTGAYSYADVDDEFISIHHFFKWLKFGFTRTYDNLSLEIRNKRLTREEAVERIRARGDETPVADIEAFCAYIGISTERFFEIAESFRNRDIWRARDGVWQIDDFLVPDWDWAASATGAGTCVESRVT